MTDHLEVGVPDPVADSRLGAGEEVVKHGDFVSEEHEAIDEMRTDEASTTGDKDTLALRGRQEPHGRETRERGVRDRLRLGIVDGLRLVRLRTSGERGVVGVRNLVLPRRILRVLRVVRAKVQRAQGVDGDLRVEAEALEADGLDLLALVVDNVNLRTMSSTRRARRGARLTVEGDMMAGRGKDGWAADAPRPILFPRDGPLI